MIDSLGAAARAASSVIARTPTTLKNDALEAMAAGLLGATDDLVSANEADMAGALADGVTGALADRLLLTSDRVAAMAEGLRTVARLPDPVGMHTGGWRLHNGIELQRIRTPLGVVAVIYEARPNVTADAGGLAFKAGNAVILRGSSSALSTNTAIVAVLQSALSSVGLPASAIQLLEDTSREAAAALMQANEWIDLLVPRGGPGLIQAMIDHATVPYVIDGAGNCHVYVDEAADLDQALAITLNAKTSRPGVCNAAESLVVHDGIAADFLPKAAAALMAEGVELRGDPAARALVPEMVEATEEDHATEFLDLIMSVKVVPTVEAAVDHIRANSSGHTEAIVSQDHGAIGTFVAGIDSAVIVVNASTRFTDGGEFGFGAEIGNSTQKLHVRGPMGLEALTSERYVLYGDGQTR